MFFEELYQKYESSINWFNHVKAYRKSLSETFPPYMEAKSTAVFNETVLYGNITSEQKKQVESILDSIQKMHSIECLHIRHESFIAGAKAYKKHIRGKCTYAK